jgi:hypothetical protein
MRAFEEQKAHERFGGVAFRKARNDRVDVVRVAMPELRLPNTRDGAPAASSTKIVRSNSGYENFALVNTSMS